MAPAATSASSSTLTHDQIISRCKDLNLDTSGSDDVLLARIAKHLTAQAKGSNANGSSANGKGGKNSSAAGKKKRRKKKKGGATNGAAGDKDAAASTENGTGADKGEDGADDVEIEYVPPPIEAILPSDSEEFQQFADVFAKFRVASSFDEEAPITDEQQEGDENGKDKEAGDEADVQKADGSDSDSDAEGQDDDKKKVSKKKLRKMNRLTVAELKQLVNKPEVVEWVDVTAADPKLLVWLKAYRNSVPVPLHWSQKRKYLQGKRGIVKKPFELPDFIKDTGIMEMREAVKEKEESARMKSKTRERHQPKMGKLDIDYQRLHDAFFRWQTKPKLTIHGDMYYEGKEFETKLKSKKPGDLSQELIAALNIPPLAPPPWLINMQRYGPPPSYPNLKIPGLNAPIPEGAQWGYHPGGWGKPPVDEYNRPLYGDVFGMEKVEVPSEHIVPVEKKLWGELEEEEESEEEEEEEEEGGEEEEGREEEAPGIESGLVTPSGLTSVPSGLETPDFIELRKDVRRSGEDEPKQLYTVIPQKETAIRGFMGSQHVYDISAAVGSSTSSTTKKRKGPGGAGVEVALNPEDLEAGLDEETVKRKYEERLGETAAGGEDFSDMVAEHASKQAKKRKMKEDKKDKGKKEFKF
ncbi:Splicing factor 3B subunit 2 [Quaeritorhiza haematococci]|nr:Splicing factor 3B subunit 2 [Quaeritorhiza haematococci]